MPTEFESGVQVFRHNGVRKTLPLEAMRLILYFTSGVSLQTWAENGSLRRETALFEHMARKQECHFVTYGGAADRRHARDFPGIHVHCNRWSLSPRCYHRFITDIQPFSWRGAVFRTNQLLGAPAALRACRRAKGKFVVRCGYSHSFTMEQVHGWDSPEAHTARRMEQEVFAAADHIVVTTERIQQDIIEKYDTQPSKLCVIPNFVQPEVFAITPGRYISRERSRVLYIGRLAEEKRLHLLIDAVARIRRPVELVLVGQGPLEDQLRDQARRSNIAVRFVGPLPNHALPKILAEADIFVLPSAFEGHPKALIEAMSCGVPVAAANAPGINDVITDGHDGLLAAGNAEALSATIDRLLQDPQLRERLGHAARKTVATRYAFDRIVDLEESLLARLANRPVTA